jgi:hypothetical protein
VQGPGNDKLYRMKGNNPSPTTQNQMRGRFPGENSAPHMDYPLNEEVSQPVASAISLNVSPHVN